MYINQTMKGLKVLCDETNPETLDLIKTVLESSGKFIIVSEVSHPANATRKFGHFLFNSEIRTLQWKKDEPVSITCRENKILLMLLENAGRVVARRRLLSSFWGYDNEYASRSLDIFIHHLRQKLRKDPRVTIHTIRGEGFMLTH